MSPAYFPRTHVIIVIRPLKEERPAEITALIMHQMASRICSAMAFLETRSVIHRDIAARNILVGELATDVKLVSHSPDAAMLLGPCTHSLNNA